MRRRRSTSGKIITPTSAVNTGNGKGNMNLWIDKKQIWAILILICIGAILSVVFRGMDTDPKKEILAVSRHFFSLIAISFAAGLFGVKPWWAGPALGIASLVVSVYQVAMSDAIMFGGPAGPIMSFAYPCVIGGFFCLLGMLMRSRKFRQSLGGGGNMKQLIGGIVLAVIGGCFGGLGLCVIRAPSPGTMGSISSGC